MALNFFYCPKCRRWRSYETTNLEAFCNICCSRMTRNPNSHPAQYSTNPSSHRLWKIDHNGYWPKRKTPRPYYSPPHAPTLISPAPFSQITPPAPQLLQPSTFADPIPSFEAPSSNPPLQAQAIEPVAKSSSSSVGTILFLVLMGFMILILGAMAKSAFGDGGTSGGSSNSLCSQLAQKIESVGSCYGQGGCQNGWSYCETKPYGGNWGHGCVPDKCR